jgi:hypothetical protein
MQATALGISNGAPQPALSANHLADVDRAIAAARESAAPCLLRCELPLGEVDILARYAPLALAAELPFIMHRPHGEQTIIAWGPIEIAHGAAASRFVSAMEHCSRVRELKMVGGAERTPLWVGGAAFAGSGAARGELFAADAWAGWPDARFWIPRTMLLAGDGDGRAVITTWVRPADQRDAIVTTLLEELSALWRMPAHRHGQAVARQTRHDSGEAAKYGAPAPAELAPRVGRNAWVSLESEDAWAKRVAAACDVIGAGGMKRSSWPAPRA